MRKWVWTCFVTEWDLVELWRYTFQTRFHHAQP